MAPPSWVCGQPAAQPQGPAAAAGRGEPGQAPERWGTASLPCYLQPRPVKTPVDQVSQDGKQFLGLTQVCLELAGLRLAVMLAPWFLGD